MAKLHIIIEKCTSGHELLLAESHVNSASHILELTQKATSTFPVNKSTSPANTCITTQRFHSTRKRRKKNIIRLIKPSTQEKQTVMEYLLENKPLYKEKGITKGESVHPCFL